MVDSVVLPEAIKQVRNSLEPFIQPRQEVAHIRRVLAAFLNSHVNAADGHPISPPLSLIDATSNVETVSSGVRGFRKEYIRCVQANIKAQEEYAKISRDHQLQLSFDSQQPKTETREYQSGPDECGASLRLYIELNKQRRKHERLSKIQDYVDTLAQKSAAAVDHLDPKSILKDVESLPQVPPDVVKVVGASQESEFTDVTELVNQLEKSVLRAKLLLKKEQKLLTKVKTAAQSTDGHSSTSSGIRLQALGTTRNELISWIEGELGKASESPPTPDYGQNVASPEREGKEYLDSQLKLIGRQYAKYTKARQELVLAASGDLEPIALETNDNLEPPAPKLQPESVTVISHFIYPHLEELVSIANEQKSMIQQKSHLSIRLAKHLKEAGQGLDRLADESHLLPAYPMPATTLLRKGVDGLTSFADEMSNSERPDSSRRARAWIFAAASATAATNDTVQEKLEEGEIALVDARHTLLELQQLLGNGDVANAPCMDKEVTRHDRAQVTSGSEDMWAALDGQLGVIEDNTK